jgi:hypothetical protein
MERTYLQFSVINTITVVLMASMGVVVLGTIAAALQTYGPHGGSNA